MSVASELSIAESHTAPSDPTEPSTSRAHAWRSAMQPLLLKHRRVATVAANLAIVAGAYVGAIALRFDCTVPRDLEPILLTTLGICIATLSGFACINQAASGPRRDIAI